MRLKGRVGLWDRSLPGPPSKTYRTQREGLDGPSQKGSSAGVSTPRPMYLHPQQPSLQRHPSLFFLWSRQFSRGKPGGAVETYQGGQGTVIEILHCCDAYSFAVQAQPGTSRLGDCHRVAARKKGHHISEPRDAATKIGRLGTCLCLGARGHDGQTKQTCVGPACCPMPQQAPTPEFLTVDAC